MAGVDLEALLAGLNEEQRAAVLHKGSHVLVLAGAGTGKTKTLTTRAAYLIASGVETQRILMLTFTRKAAAQMTTRLQQMIGPQSKGVLAGTFHHFCLRAMRFAPKVFDAESITVIDRDDQLQLFRMARTKFADKNKIVVSNPEVS